MLSGCLFDRRLPKTAQGSVACRLQNCLPMQTEYLRHETGLRLLAVIPIRPDGCNSSSSTYKVPNTRYSYTTQGAKLHRT